MDADESDFLVLESLLVALDESDDEEEDVVDEEDDDELEELDEPERLSFL